MTVERVDVIGRNAGNGAPFSGDVLFSDGKFYGWRFSHTGGEIIFFGSRKRCSEWERFMFQSPKRAALLIAHLDAL